MRTQGQDPPSPLYNFARILETHLPLGLRAYLMYGPLNAMPLHGLHIEIDYVAPYYR